MLFGVVGQVGPRMYSVDVQCRWGGDRPMESGNFGVYIYEHVYLPNMGKSTITNGKLVTLLCENMWSDQAAI